VKFVDNGMLTLTSCRKCGGHFVTHPHEIARHYVCGMCNPPARAGKGKLAGGLQLGSASASSRRLGSDPVPGLATAAPQPVADADAHADAHAH
jgi:hypothetical protein